MHPKCRLLACQYANTVRDTTFPNVDPIISICMFPVVYAYASVVIDERKHIST